MFSYTEDAESRIVLREEATFRIPAATHEFSQSALSQRALLAAVRVEPGWRFAWVDAGGQVFVVDRASSSGESKPRTLLSGVNGGRRLDFSRDGRFLVLQHYAGPSSEARIRVWDLDDARAREVSAMDLSALRREACRIAALDSPKDSLLTDPEKTAWTGPSAAQPCGSELSDAGIY